MGPWRAGSIFLIAATLLLPLATATPGTGSFLLTGKTELPKNTVWEFEPLLLFNNESGLSDLLISAPSVLLIHGREDTYEASTPLREMQTAYDDNSTPYELADVQIRLDSDMEGGFVGVYPQPGSFARMVSAQPAELEPRVRTEVNTRTGGKQAEGPEETRWWYKQTLDEAHLHAAFPGSLHLEGPFRLKVFGPDVMVKTREDQQTFVTGIERSSTLPVRTATLRWVIMDFPEGATLDASASSDWLVAARGVSADWKGEVVLNPTAGSFETWKMRYSAVGGAVRLEGEFEGHFVPVEKEGVLLAEVQLRGDVLGTTLRAEEAPLGARLVHNPVIPWVGIGVGLVALSMAALGAQRVHSKHAASRPRQKTTLLPAAPPERVELAFPLTAEDYVDAAEKAAREEDWPQAAHWLGRAHPLAPTSSRICADLAHAHHQMGDYAEAIRLYQKAAQLAPDGDAQAHFLTAVVALKADRPLPEVEEWIVRTLQRDPTTAAEVDRDPDFKILRGRPRFEAALSAAWEILERREGEEPT